MTQTRHIISANDLRSGLNVFFIQSEKSNQWDVDISKATLFDEDQVAAAFEQAKQDMDQNIVVDCLVVDVDENRTPLTTREKIRADGPSTKYGSATK